MTVCVELIPEARARLREQTQWWENNRPAARALYAQEVKRALQLLAHAPQMGTPYQQRHAQGFRRLLLRRIQIHIYYRYDADKAEVTVHAIWPALRGKSPRLSP